MKFYCLGDIGYYNDCLKKTIDVIKNKIYENKTDNDAIVLLGDNFYQIGVTGINDKQWNKFEDCFKNIDLPVYPLLGNHDYIANPFAQILYKKNNWNMPHWYYTKKYKFIQFWWLDTQILAPNSGPNISRQHIESRHYNTKASILQERQLDWFENSLKKSDALCKIVFGHYPIFSNGSYDNNSELISHILPLFKKYNVKFYISGHDHNTQLIQKKYSNNYTLNQIICGSSASFVHNISKRNEASYYLPCHSYVEIESNIDSKLPNLNVSCFDINNKNNCFSIKV